MTQSPERKPFGPALKVLASLNGIFEKTSRKWTGCSSSEPSPKTGGAPSPSPQDSSQPACSWPTSKKKKMEEAIRLVLKAPGEVETMEGKGLIQFGMLTPAIEKLEKAISKGYLDAYHLLGDTLLNMGRIKEGKETHATGAAKGNIHCQFYLISEQWREKPDAPKEAQEKVRKSPWQPPNAETHRPSSSTAPSPPPEKPDGPST